MRVSGDFHLHTTASDGRCSINAHAKKADEMGLEEIAITDHGFASTIFHMTEKKFEKQEREISALNCKVCVLHGVEGNLVNTLGDIDIPADIVRRCDVLIVGFHRYIGFKGEKRGGYDRKWLFENGFCGINTREKLKEINTAAYIKALDKFPIDTLAHLNHRALIDVKKLAQKAKEVGAYVELNEKHIDALEEFADDLNESGVSFIVGTDAHDTRKTGKIEKIKDFIQRHEIDEKRVFGINGNAPKFKDKKEWCENGFKN